MLLDLVVTNRCNLKCSYCFESGDDKMKYNNGSNYFKSSDMTYFTACSAIDFFYKLAKKKKEKFISLTFFGGEPLIRFPFITEIFNYIEDNYNHNGVDFYYGVTTNATLLNKDMIEYFLLHSFSLMFSIDGCKEGHDIERKLFSGGGSFGLIETRLGYICEFISRTVARASIKMIITPRNVKYLYQSILYLSKFNCPISFDINFEAEWDQKGLDIYREQISKVLKNYYHIKKENVSVVEIEKIIDYCRYKYNREVGVFEDCGAGINRFNVSTTGDIYGCARFQSANQLCLGNVMEGFSHITNPFENKGVTTNQCQNCKIAYMCMGHCYAINLLLSGSLYKPDDVVCKFTQATVYEVLSYIQEKQNE